MPSHAEAFLESLNDPKKYKIIRGVPVFRPHRRSLPEWRDPETGVVHPAIEIVVSPDDLREIGARTEASGPQVMTEGHRSTDPKTKEKDQPRKTGWEVNHRPGMYVFDPKIGPEPALLADMHYDKDIFDEVGPHRYPFRSADYDFQEKKLTGMALLMRRPFLDLGMISDTAYAHKNHIVQYAMEFVMPDVTPKEEEDKITAEEEAQYAKVCRYLAKKDKKFATYAKSKMPRMAKYFDEGMAGDPSATGTEMTYDGNPKPGSDGFKAMKAKEDPDYPWYDDKDYQSKQRIAQYQSENEVLKNRLATEHAERLLIEVKDVVKFNKDRELKTLIAMSESDRPGHIAYMRETYEKLPRQGFIPIDSTGIPNSGNTGNQPPKMNEVQYQAARSYMTTNKCTWEAAHAFIMANVRA